MGFSRIYEILIGEIKSFRNILKHRFFIDPKTEKGIVDQFTLLYFESRKVGKTWGNTCWLGVPTLKCALDLWVYQEIIYEHRPDIIIECGTKYGAGALFLATICDIVKQGNVITIDIESKGGIPKHDRITYLNGSSTSNIIVEKVKKMIEGTNTVMVILDSDHSKAHVLKELSIYNKFVTPGSYLIVEDTCVNGHPVLPEFGPGPMEAIDEFMKENKDFVIDREKEKFYLTFNPRGFLKKK